MRYAGGLLLVAAAIALPSSAAEQGALPPCPGAAERAKVVLLVDLTAGRTLCERAGDVPFLPASMTKVMTALVVFELIDAGKLDEAQVVTIRPETAQRWAGKGTTLNLKPGEQVTIGELLMGTTVVSANDASVALAEAAMGSTEAFIAQMNAKARELGMTKSRFATPSGFPDGGATIVTARDMVRLGQALIGRHPKLYRRYIGKKTMIWHGQTLTSHDPFAGVLPGADGIKTGHTFAAGFNFLGAVEREGRRLVLVVGGARTETDRANAARDMAEWGYAEWTAQPFLTPQSVVGAARVQGGAAREVRLAPPRAFPLALPKDYHGKVSGRILYQGPLNAPLAKGQQVAVLRIETPGLPSYDLPLVTTSAVAAAGPIDRLVNGLLGLFE
ncbi:MAG TPA: D-alanyl-D-alanine carboxypeptidase family protein [Novosphingobium sp.]|nr:D-alanyl-D-alanine carboxypeptidase family protein [Novosphingobium sp.]HQA18843.1 D-alanyl-D-alanine carboxypeptidase family protein [Novosphingobium sp.]